MLVHTKWLWNTFNQTKLKIRGGRPPLYFFVMNIIRKLYREVLYVTKEAKKQPSHIMIHPKHEDKLFEYSNIRNILHKENGEYSFYGLKVIFNSNMNEDEVEILFNLKSLKS